MKKDVNDDAVAAIESGASPDQVFQAVHARANGPSKCFDAPPSDDTTGVISSTEASSWPSVLGVDAFYGLAGEVVRVIEPHSESDPVALLIQFLTAFGNFIGRGCHWRAEGDEHHGNLFSVLVGRSGKGRKGTSWSQIRNLFLEIGNWSKERVKSGLSSGEGMIWAVRDAVFKTDPETNEQVIVDAGIDDKRLMLVETEFAQVLKQLERTGNTLSPLVRQAWERGNLESLTKNSPAKATDAHISIVGHITKSELLRYLTSTESANGFANRILWLCVSRSKELPEGGNLSQTSVAILRGSLHEVAEAARNAPRLLKRDAGAKDLWASVYGELTAEREGLAAAVCGRAEAQTMRLSMLYALLDGANEINVLHLKAALAVWRYCEQSATCIFGDVLGDPVADEIADALRRAPAGLPRNAIRDHFGRNKSSSEIGRALGVLARAGIAYPVQEPTEGRPTERWFATPRRTR